MTMSGITVRFLEFDFEGNKVGFVMNLMEMA